MIFLKPKKTIYLGRYDISFSRPRIGQRNGLSQIRRKLAQKPELLLFRISLHLLCFERFSRFQLGLLISALNARQSRSSPRKASYLCFSSLSIFRLASFFLIRSRLSYFFKPRAKAKESLTSVPLVYTWRGIKVNPFSWPLPSR